MMANYEFTETSSSTVIEGDKRFRKIYFRGVDPEHELNVDGNIPKVPELDYFMAGVEGKLGELIRDFVIKKITEAPEEEQESAE